MMSATWGDAAPGVERVEGVGVAVVAFDGQVATAGLGADAVEGPLGDVAGGDLPALLGQPQRVAALSGADVEVERTVVEVLAELKPGRELYANVEFYAGAVMTERTCTQR